MIHILSSLENFWRKFASKVNKKYNNFLGKFRWAKKSRLKSLLFGGLIIS
jgi:type IV secretory pathway TraG/TraD family ATPase VirD4